LWRIEREFLNSLKINMKNKSIALVAHDHKKKDLVEWVKLNKEKLSSFNVYATGTTGKLIEEEVVIPVLKLKSGPLGGDQQIGALIAEEKIDVLIFFWDPLEAQSHDPDIKALLRLAVVWNIPMACNRSTADMIFSSVLLTSDYKRTVPDYKGYENRKL
jgi:methylglyoxal synthase